jgi:hypothetical protein
MTFAGRATATLRGHRRCLGRTAGATLAGQALRARPASRAEPGLRLPGQECGLRGWADLGLQPSALPGLGLARGCPACGLPGGARLSPCQAEPGLRPARWSPACAPASVAQPAPARRGVACALLALPGLCPARRSLACGLLCCPACQGGAWPAPCWCCPACVLPGGAWLAAYRVARPARAGPGLRPAGVAGLLVLPGLCPAGRCLACGLLALPGLRCCPACSRAGRAAGTGLGRRCGGVGGAFGSVAMSHEGR